MESTGVYWIPVSEILEARGFHVHLANARHLKHVPGRKSDVKDCQWIQYVHTCGLLSGSCRPAAEMYAVRAYLRHRATLLEYRAARIQHMQQALQQMHVQLTHVLTDITGATGLAMIRAMVAGERDPVQRARLRAPHCASSTAGIAKALRGPYQPEHVFALKQALALYDASTEQRRECDAEIERRFQAIKPVWPDELPPLNRANKHATHNKKAPTYAARSLLYQLTGVALIAIPGLNARTVQTIRSEIGVDLREWPHAKAFCAWLGLAPAMRARVGKCCAGARGGLATAPDKHFGARRQRSVAAGMAWEPTSGGCGPASAANQPSWPPPIKSRALSIVCSPAAPRFAI